MAQAYRKNRHAIAEKKRKQKKMIITWSSIIAAVLVLTVAMSIIVNNRVISEDKYPVVTMEVEGYGKVEIELYPNDAPNTVRNFISLAKKGFYDGLTFHRVAEDFCIQAGCPKGDGTGDAGYKIKGEFSANRYYDNTLRHEAGVISMARGEGNNTAGSQFFICTDTNSSVSALDGMYAPFGKVISGFDIIQQINKVSVSGDSKDGKPVTDVVIKSITVDTKGIIYVGPEKIR